jgi:hypothetical protein
MAGHEHFGDLAKRILGPPTYTICVVVAPVNQIQEIPGTWRTEESIVPTP